MGKTKTKTKTTTKKIKKKEVKKVKAGNKKLKKKSDKLSFINTTKLTESLMELKEWLDDKNLSNVEAKMLLRHILELYEAENTFHVINDFFSSKAQQVSPEEFKEILNKNKMGEDNFDYIG